MCHSRGRPPTSTIGLGRYSVSSRMRVPMPPHSRTTLGATVELISLSIDHGRMFLKAVSMTGRGPSRRLKSRAARADGRAMAATAEQILALVAEYAAERHAPQGFDPASPAVPASGRVFGDEEVVELVRTSLDFWLTAGP